MNTSNSLAFRLNLILLILALLLVGAGGSLGLITMKMEIESTAQNVRELERKLDREEREGRYLDSRIARLHQPRELMRRVAEAGLPLQAPNPRQVVHLPGGRYPTDYREGALVADRRLSGSFQTSTRQSN